MLDLTPNSESRVLFTDIHRGSRYRVFKVLHMRPANILIFKSELDILGNDLLRRRVILEFQNSYISSRFQLKQCSKSLGYGDLERWCYLIRMFVRYL